MKNMLRSVWYPLVAALIVAVSLLTAQSVEAATDFSDKITYSNLDLRNPMTNETIDGSNSTVGNKEQSYKYTGDFDLTQVRGAVAGDYFKIPIPTNVIVADATYPVYADEAKTIQMGTMQVDKASNQITITFNDQVKDDYLVSGNFNLSVDTTIEDGVNTYTLMDGRVITVTYKYQSATDILAGLKILNEILFKSGDTQSVADNYIQWYARINRISRDFGTDFEMVIEDALVLDESAMAAYLPDSFVLQEVRYTGDKESLTTDYDVVKEWTITRDEAAYQADLDGSTAFLSFSNANTAFTLKLGKNIGDKSFRLVYRTTNPADGSVLKNGISAMIGSDKLITFTSLLGTPNTSTVHTARVVAQQSGGATIRLVSKIKIVKYDAEDAGKRLAGVRFQITSLATGQSSIHTTDSKGEIVTETLPTGQYKVAEIEAAPGYQLDSQERVVTVRDTDVTYVNVANTKDTTTSSSSSSSSSSTSSSSTSSSSTTQASSSSSSSSSTSSSSTTQTSSSSSSSSLTSSSSTTQTSSSSSASSSTSSSSTTQTSSSSSSTSMSSSSTLDSSSSTVSSSSSSTVSSSTTTIVSSTTMSSSSSSTTASSTPTLVSSSPSSSSSVVSSTSTTSDRQLPASSSSSVGKVLPQTGASQSMTAVVLGIALLLLSLSYVAVAGKQDK